jgi:hypothetical protein
MPTTHTPVHEYTPRLAPGATSVFAVPVIGGHEDDAAFLGHHPVDGVEEAVEAELVGRLAEDL